MRAGAGAGEGQAGPGSVWVGLGVCWAEPTPPLHRGTTPRKAVKYRRRPYGLSVSVCASDFPFCLSRGLNRNQNVRIKMQAQFSVRSAQAHGSKFFFSTSVAQEQKYKNRIGRQCCCGSFSL